tara:strand:+ start:2261 stop:2518 length:258 start_codon:yes stop_codon:yes gene_type:complete
MADNLDTRLFNEFGFEFPETKIEKKENSSFIEISKKQYEHFLLLYDKAEMLVNYKELGEKIYSDNMNQFLINNIKEEINIIKKLT